MAALTLLQMIDRYTDTCNQQLAEIQKLPEYGALRVCGRCSGKLTVVAARYALADGSAFGIDVAIKCSRCGNQLADVSPMVAQSEYFPPASRLVMPVLDKLAARMATEPKMDRIKGLKDVISLMED